MRLLPQILLVNILAAILLALSIAAIQPAAGQGTPAPQESNAAWIDHRWVGTAQSQAAIGALCTLLHTHGIGEVYVHVGPADGAGRIADGRAPYAGRFVNRFHGACPGVRALAWIGQLLPVWDGLLNLHDPTVRAGLATTAAHFTALGFDGVQYDLEPVATGDAALLDLLRRTRAAIGSHWLAVATPALIPSGGLPPLPHLRLPLTPWSGAYYASVAALADEADPMLYITALRDPVSYTRFIAEQSRDLALALPSTRIRLGVPAFTGRDPAFDDRAENLESALAGLSRAFPARAWPRALAGIAIYPLWDMTPTQWSTYDRWTATVPPA